MQQQIQIVNEDGSLCDIDQISESPQLQTIQGNPKEQILTLPPEQQEIEQHINENYQQEFESISQDFQEEPFEEITEEQPQVLSFRKRTNHDIVMLDEGESKIEVECRQMEKQIQKMKAVIYEKEQEMKMDNSSFFNLMTKVNEKEEQAQNLEKQNHSWLQTKFGKQAFSLPLLMAQDDTVEQKMQEKIIEMNSILQMTMLQIQRCRREVTKKAQELPELDEQKQCMYEQYNKIKRQIDLKCEKRDKQQSKIEELEKKIESYKEKIQNLDVSDYDKIIEKEKEQQELQIRYKNVIKEKDIANKKNKLTQHQLQTSCSGVARAVLVLRKNNEQIQIKIEALDKKNNFIEEDSNKLMEIYYNRRKQTSPQKEQSKDYRLQIRQSPIQMNKKQVYVTRKRNFTEMKRSPLVNRESKHDKTLIEETNLHKRYQSNVEKEKSESKEPEGLRISSTVNELQPQFKLKLSSKKSWKPSQKKINISMELQDKKRINSNIFSKLSVTQRMQHIELLEQQDKLYSYKLYPQKKKDNNRVNKSNRQSNTTSFAQTKSYSLAEMNIPSNNTFIKGIYKNIPQRHTTTQDLGNIGFPKIQSNQYQQNIKSYALKQTEKNDSDLGTLSESQITLPNHPFMRRKVFKEKKLTEEYMMMLQQRGRKILELDTQSQV